MPIEWIGNNLIKLTSEGKEKFFPVFYEERSTWTFRTGA